MVVNSASSSGEICPLPSNQLPPPPSQLLSSYLWSEPGAWDYGNIWPPTLDPPRRPCTPLNCLSPAITQSDDSLKGGSRVIWEQDVRSTCCNGTWGKWLPIRGERVFGKLKLLRSSTALDANRPIILHHCGLPPSGTSCNICTMKTITKSTITVFFSLLF